jgi:hypothetical protein
MYGVERSVVALLRAVGNVEGMTILEVKGSVGVSGVGVVVLRLGTVMLFGRSHAVCSLISDGIPAFKDWVRQIPCLYQPEISFAALCW